MWKIRLRALNEYRLDDLGPTLCLRLVFWGTFLEQLFEVDWEMEWLHVCAPSNKGVGNVRDLFPAVQVIDICMTIAQKWEGL
mmetsp:Transcript_10441/g.63855  ORF Transcript_10441/g.63855 Transcript_10441/m.63855 type:complete len:82 (-) Transcript_10441:3207-3452(-)